MKRMHRRIEIMTPVGSKIGSVINFIDKNNPLTPHGSAYVTVGIIGIILLWLVFK